MTSLSATDWGFEPAGVSCDQCGWSYLVPHSVLPASTAAPLRCPHCYAGNLSPLDAISGEADQTVGQLSPPELMLPFHLPGDKLAAQLTAFSKGIPFAPTDLNPPTLAGRLKRVYLPQWLVDVGVKAGWQMEAGFDYDVVSHQERYSDTGGGWSTREVKETRVRWEPRQGNLDRSYPNRTAPALETHDRLRGQLGEFDLAAAKQYQSQAAQEAFVRLPDRDQTNAWPEVIPGLQAAAAKECQMAAGADHQRDFRWQPDFHNQNWTLLLRPVFTSYYLDDQNQPQPVLINGQTGQVSGKRRASMKRAQRTSLVTLAAAAVIFLFSVLFLLGGIALPVLVPFGGLGLFIAILVGLGAIIPPVLVWQFNRSNR